jgi:3-hydroxymyristoyl/3-hydroxydecanoyl-(acyl carrier protein) dehydratase
MSDLKRSEDGSISARFVFPEDFTGFQGHFPDKKILPGVCQVQSVINMVEKWEDERLILKEVVLAKFLSSVSHSEELMCSCNVIDGPDGDRVLKATFNKDSRKIAEIKLRVRYDR